jgi:hypothetical protein
MIMFRTESESKIRGNEHAEDISSWPLDPKGRRRNVINSPKKDFIIGQIYKPIYNSKTLFVQTIISKRNTSLF